MGDLYFILGFLFLAFELLMGFNAKLVLLIQETSVETFRKIDAHRDESRRFLLYALVYLVMQFVYLLWALVGAMFSSQHLLFAVLIASGFLWSLLRSLLRRLNKKYTYIVVVADSTVSSAIICLAMYNHFIAAV